MPITVDKPYRSALSSLKLTWNGAALAANGLYQEFARFTIPQGVAWQLGFGAVSTQDGADGRFFMDLRDDTAAPGVEQNGFLRISVFNTQDRQVSTLWESRTESLRSSETDRRQQIPVSEVGPVLTQNYAFVFQLKPDAAFTPGSTNTIILLDMTEYSAHF